MYFSQHMNRGKCYAYSYECKMCGPKHIVLIFTNIVILILVNITYASIMVFTYKTCNDIINLVF
jgi:hypothetical protein